MSLTLCIDPGLDATGWAIFEYRRGPAIEQLRGLQQWGVWRTKPRDPLPQRLVTLHQHVLQAASAAQHVLIERPTIAGTYARHRPKAVAGPIEVFHLALGAIITAAVLGLGGRAEPLLVPASRLPKSARHRRLARLLREVGLGPVESPDARDAIWMGWTTLVSRASFVVA